MYARGLEFADPEGLQDSDIVADGGDSSYENILRNQDSNEAFAGLRQPHWEENHPQELMLSDPKDSMCMSVYTNSFPGIQK